MWLQLYLEREFEEKREFIDSCVLFRDWNAKNKKLLERALCKECYAMDMPVVKQGQPMRGLLFIRRLVASCFQAVPNIARPVFHQTIYMSRLFVCHITSRHYCVNLFQYLLFLIL